MQAIERAAIADHNAKGAGRNTRNWCTGEAEGTINGRAVRCVYAVTRRNPPSGIVTECMQALWYIDGKRASAAKVQALASEGR